MATILIVDDERPVREFLAELFESAGHRILQAVHGRQALDLVQQARPDLVISDIMMPVLGGDELCRRLKANPSTGAIPVILMSAAGRRPGVDAGADAYIDKPFNLDAVEALVERSLAPDPAAGASAAASS